MGVPPIEINGDYSLNIFRQTKITVNKEDIITKVSAIAEDDYAKHLEKI
jgi:hypothetical protein